MRLMRSLAVVAGLAVGGALAAHAASIAPITTPQDPSQLNSTLNNLIQSINQGVSGYQPLNFLDNGSMIVTQRGTGIATGGTTSGPGIAAYAADRWAIECNVTSCAPRGAVVTSASGVTFAPGFPNMLSVYRNSGALTQPVCAEQEIESSRFTTLQGRNVILSAYLAANTGFPSGGTITGYLITGTGTDQGLGALRSAVGVTASPALTPVWTGLATAGVTLTAGPSSATPLSVTATRFSSDKIPVPTTATEGAVLFCFTPGAETAGTADGFLITGAQLEQADNNQVTAGRYQRPPTAVELLQAQRFFWQISDPAATVNIPSSCNVTTANTTVKCGVWLPTQMQAVPVTTVSTATSFGIWLTAGTAGTCTTLAASASSNTVNNIGVTCTTGGTIALGTGTNLIGAATVGTLSSSADY